MTKTESPSKINTFDVRGVTVAAIDLIKATEVVAVLAKISRGDFITVTGAHGIVESAYSDKILNAHRRAALVVPDGMPLVWLGRLLGFKSMGRVYGPDLMASVFSRADLRQLRHFFYGSTTAVQNKLEAKILLRFGDFNLAGGYVPPIQPIDFEEDARVLAQMRALRPNIIWVGLSTPKQELWLLKHMPKIGCGVGIGVGAAFDLLSGTTIQAPRWMQRSGLEWIFRLAVEPRRLFRRYFFIVPRFLYYMGETLFMQRRSS